MPPRTPRRIDWRQVIRDELADADSFPTPVVTSVHPDVKPADTVAVAYYRPTPRLFVEAHLRTGPAGLAVGDLHVTEWDADPPFGITTTDLRSISPTTILEQAAAQVAELDVYVETPPAVAEALEAVEKRRRPDVRRGRVGYGDEHYRQVALDYLRLQAQYGARGVRKRLAEELGYQDATIRDWLHEAGVRGFVVSRGQGRAGREPGPRLTEGRDR